MALVSGLGHQVPPTALAVLVELLQVIGPFVANLPPVLLDRLPLGGDVVGRQRREQATSDDGSCVDQHAKALLGAKRIPLSVSIGVVPEELAVRVGVRQGVGNPAGEAQFLRDVELRVAQTPRWRRSRRRHR
jgi:hypothetical protein